MPFPPQILQRVRPLTPLSRLPLKPCALKDLHTIASDLRDFIPGPHIALFLGSDRISPALAAEALAHEVHRDLLRLDLGLLTAYVGDTQQDLNHLIHTTQPQESILFFDEADALFGRRSTIRDDHDRYAPLDIDSLLRRLQDFPGLSILGTNSVTNPHPGIDIRYTVHLPQIPLPPPHC